MTSRRARRAALLGGALLSVEFLGVEAVHRQAARRGFPGAGPPDGAVPEVVLVLGYPSRRGDRTHPLQRWRTAIAVRSVRSAGGRLVFTGGPSTGGRPEAAVMADHAEQVLGFPRSPITVETRARSTWQNIALSLPELGEAGTIRIASVPTHAARARRYLARQRPDLAGRLAPADDYRFGERHGWKLASLTYAVARSVWLRVATPA